MLSKWQLKMPDIRAELYVPVLLPYSLHEKSREMTVSMIGQVLDLHVIKIPFIEEQEIAATIEQIAPKDSVPGVVVKAMEHSARKYIILRFVAIAPGDPLPYYDMDGTLAGYSGSVNNSLLETGLSERIADLVVLSNIASPGAVELGSQFLFINGNFFQSRQGILNSLECVWRMAEQNGWPLLDRLPLRMTLDWASKPKWLLDEFGGTPLSRALNAFSHIFGSEPDLGALSILYSLMGIEALYASGGQGIAHQIFEKTQVVLGRAPGLKKNINRMYDFRSRLVHGQIDFPACFRNGSAWEMQHRAELSDASSLAETIIVATFQKMIKNGWKSLDFDYVVREAAP